MVETGDTQEVGNKKEHEEFLKNHKKKKETKNKRGINSMLADVPLNKRYHVQ